EPGAGDKGVPEGPVGVGGERGRSREQNQASDDTDCQDYRDTAVATEMVGGEGASDVGQERRAEEHQERARREDEIRYPRQPPAGGAQSNPRPGQREKEHAMRSAGRQIRWPVVVGTLLGGVAVGATGHQLLAAPPSFTEAPLYRADLTRLANPELIVSRLEAPPG